MSNNNYYQNDCKSCKQLRSSQGNIGDTGAINQNLVANVQQINLGGNAAVTYPMIFSSNGTNISFTPNTTTFSLAPGFTYRIQLSINGTTKGAPQELSVGIFINGAFILVPTSISVIDGYSSATGVINYSATEITTFTVVNATNVEVADFSSYIDIQQID